MAFHSPPPTAAWRHRGARSGFEVVYFRSSGDGRLLEGCTTALEDGATWVVDYVIGVDDRWTTRSAWITGRSVHGSASISLDADGLGRWWIDGEPAPHLDGCLDVDLESSAMTNTLPVHRAALPIGDAMSAPAVYVRALDLAVSRLDQTYLRLPDAPAGHRYDYAAAAFDFTGVLAYDSSGLVLDYPGIALRVA